MPTDKRRRHKAGHQSRMEAARLAAARRRRRRLVRNVAVLLVVVALAVGGLVVATGGDDGGDLETTGGATTAPSTEAPDLVELTPPPEGASITGETPCPPADGSAERTTSFERPPPMCIDPAKRYSAEVVTTMGSFTVDLDVGQSPKTVNNFVVLARYHFYDGIPFHRIIPGFVVQGGSSGRPDFGSGGPGYSLDDAERPTTPYQAGSAAMAVGKDESGQDRPSGSQFFVTLDPTKLEQGAFPVLGQVIVGLEVVQQIEQAGTLGTGEPTQEVVMERVVVSEL
jgi:cyclophilin family peptidyl-prolyl cis-trans isomerase